MKKFFTLYFVILSVFCMYSAGTAMTVPEFLEPVKNENMQLAIYAVGQADAGGFEGQLRRAKEELHRAQNMLHDVVRNRASLNLAWF